MSKLLIDALRGHAVDQFTANDVNTASIVELCKEVGISERPSARELAAHKNEMFAIISEALDADAMAYIKSLPLCFVLIGIYKNYI